MKWCYYELKGSIFLELFVFFLDIWPFDVVELSIEFGLIVDHVLYVCIELLGNIFKLIPPSIFENIGCFDFITFCHNISS